MIEWVFLAVVWLGVLVIPLKVWRMSTRSLFPPDPIVLLALIFAVVMGAFCTSTVLKRRRQLLPRIRKEAGQCPACGYDLRESPERCPECGAGKSSAG